MTAAAVPALPHAGAAPRPALTIAVALGVAAGFVIPNGPPGLGLVLLGYLAAVLLWWLSPVQVRGWRAVHAVLALLLLTVTALRAAEWLVALDLAMAVGVGSLALTRARDWPGVLRGLVEVGLVLPRTTAWFVRGLRQVPVTRPVTGPAARGAALTAVLLVLFVPLLVSGDAAFATVLGRVVPDLPDLGLLPARVIVTCVAAAGVAAGLFVLLSPRPEPIVGPPARRLHHASEWLLPLGALDALLASFLAVQATVLFGGDDHVLRAAGVTYSSYAREGFGQLVAVTALVLAVVAAAVRWAPRAARPALAALCALALVVDASALWRLHLYVEAYGLSRLRLTATAFSCWLGVVIVVVLVAGIRPGRWVPHTVVASAAAGLLVLSLVNPDARIAASVIGQGERADLAYLASLSSDAAQQAARLPASAERACVLTDLAPERGLPWTSANLGRHRAEELRPTGDLLCRRAGDPLD
ncbi:MAG: hypothetical protein QOE05_1602 [Actinomycetota bacterium]|jgi:hypothetical protein|nr:hypothetical protein [Actinomycetota bacterium]